MTDDIATRVKTILKGFSEPWRWFQDGVWIVLQPPHGIITAETLSYVEHAGTHTVGAVFRVSPTPGIYLRFQLRTRPEMNPSLRTLIRERGMCGQISERPVAGMSRVLPGMPTAKVMCILELGHDLGVHEHKLEHELDHELVR